MWIKQTSVIRRGRTYTYVQLVQSFSVDGKTRHKVMANLGRADKLDLELVKALVNSITSSTSDSLQADQISLLPVKKYGATMLLKQLFETSGIERFLMDLALYRRTDTTIVSNIFALLTYFCVNDDAELSFFSWLSQTYLPQSEHISLKSLETSMILLDETPAIRSALLKPYDGISPCYHYVYWSINSNFKDLSDGAAVIVSMTDREELLSFQTLLKQYRDFKPFRADSIFVCDDFPVLCKCGGFDCNASSYICKISVKDLPLLFHRSLKIVDFFYSDGLFNKYHDIGFRRRKYEDKTVIILRPLAGYAPNMKGSIREPREIIVSNLKMPPEQILDQYHTLEKIQNCFYNLFLPSDLNYLYNRIPARNLMYAVLNLYFIKLLFWNFIEKKMAPLGLTTEDSIKECEQIVCAELNDGRVCRRFHSELTDLQTTIFNELDIKRHPSTNLFTPGNS